MKKIRKSNIAGEILFLFGIIILWQIFYVAGVDGLGIWKAYAIPSRCVEFLCGNDEAGNITCCNWKQSSPRCDWIHSFTYNRSSNRNINQSFFIFT